LTTSHTRRDFLRTGAVAAGATLLSACGAETAVVPRPTSRSWRIGVLAFSGPTSLEALASIRAALAEFKYVDGRDYVLEVRYAENDRDRVKVLAWELVQQKVDLILTIGLFSIQAAKEATSSIPIVFPGVADPVGQGLVSDLIRPGGNVTGVASPNDIPGKGLELLKTMVPNLARVAVPYGIGGGNETALRAAEEPARALGLQLIPVPVLGTVENMMSGLERAADEGAEALGSLITSNFYGRNLEKFGLVLDFVTRKRWPQGYASPDHVRAGGLMSIGANQAHGWRLVADLIDKILKGAHPGDLPIGQRHVFDIWLNLSMARKIGLTIPDAVLRRATEVIP
jgi:ABC-type uncharacterized transport system substrate-binding protein